MRWEDRLKRKNKTLQGRVGLGRIRVVSPPCGSASSVEENPDSTGQAGESMIVGRVEIIMAESTGGGGGG